uniref:C3H1-type domain-containing protein n=1 Tax=Arundo donax TaxID=35708 RepID=A0A0A9FI80_ARUDO
MEAPICGSLGAMGSLLGKLDSLLVSGRLLRRSVRKDIELLKEDLAGLNTFLLELSNEDDPNLTKKYWMKELREVCYDIEDYIDRLIHSGAKIGSVGTVSRLKIRRLPSTLNRRPKISCQIKELRARLEDADERHKRYVLDSNTSRPSHVTNGRRILTLYAEASGGRVGIDDSTEKLTKLLNNGDKQLKVLSIFGFGGIGKTTLAKHILQEHGGNFVCRAFVRVSRKPDTRNLLRSILLQTRCRQPSDACSLQQLIDCLGEHLQERRYLIVIDDLWDTTVWDIIVRALPDGTRSSRIIITTEFESVAMTCCGDRSDYTLKMEPLSDDDSEKLFFTRVFGSEDKCPHPFKDASYEIVRKCGGIPLSIINIAGLLASQPDNLELWDFVQKSLGSNLSTSPTYEEVRSVIKLSYNGLPRFLKTCLQYVSMYPENCTIWKNDLVRRWVAEGFIGPKEGEDMEAVAKNYFAELVYRGMIQPIDIYNNNNVLSCTVHNMVLDLITDKSVQDNFVTVIDYSKEFKELSTKVRRLLLCFRTAKYATKLSGITLSQVRSLAFYGLIKCLPSIMEFKFLRVLVLYLWGDYSGCTRFNLCGIHRLFQLRYLKVTCNFYLQLPTHMEGLYLLETLELNAKGTSLPADIVHLQNLLHLHLPAETTLPDEMGRMRSLRTLQGFDLSRNAEDKVKSLEELTNLHELQLICTTASSDSVDRNLNVLCSILGSLCNLKSLTLVRGISVTSNSVSIIDSSSMISPPVSLERLELHRATCIFPRLPRWLVQLGRICILKIGVVEILKNDMDSLGELPALTVLSLNVRRPIVDRIVFSSGAFPALKCFKLRAGVLCVAFQADAMQNLRRLKLCFNASRRVEYGLMLVGIEHLLNLQEISGRIGAAAGAEESDRRAAESAFKEVISNHSRNPSFNIRNVDWVEEDDVPDRNDILSKVPNVQSFEDHGILENKSQEITSKKADSRVSKFSDVLESSLDLLNSEAMWQMDQGEAEESWPNPERPGESDCSYYMRTGFCRFGMTCKYNHPPDRKLPVADVRMMGEYPQRIGQPECQYYLKTDTCKSGASGKFHHPREKAAEANRVQLNALGYPLRLKEMECQYYLRTGQCKFGSRCKYHHPEPSNAMAALRIGSSFSDDRKRESETTSIGDHGMLYHAGSVPIGLLAVKRENVFPERPGQPECQFYMATGYCKFGAACKFHHPMERTNPSPNCALSPLGLPLRPGEPVCTFYSRYGMCRFGPNCKFDHPIGTLIYGPASSTTSEVPNARRIMAHAPSHSEVSPGNDSGRSRRFTHSDSRQTPSREEEVKHALLEMQTNKAT